MRIYPSRRMLGATVIIGMGGLGCPAAVALAEAGARRLTLVDGDVVETSNLHRQPLYGPEDVGRPKVEVAGERLSQAFPGLEVETWARRVGPPDVEPLLARHALAIDGTDSVGAKFLLSDAVARIGTPLVSGGVVQWGGQAMRIDPGGACLRCLYGTAPREDEVPTCARAGVLGSLAGVLGALQASLALGPASPAGRSTLHVVDGRTLRFRTLTVRRVPDCPGCGARA
ncbi:MAG: HesA/MoeB/ThiF family protein [Myxococcaceae bacterium]|nr:MAG: HesA/MoeB/ThiF family protein [Myxococcaceae bacterium]